MKSEVGGGGGEEVCTPIIACLLHKKSNMFVNRIVMHRNKFTLQNFVSTQMNSCAL